MIRFPVPSARNTYLLAVTNSPVNSVAPNLKGIVCQSVYASAVWLMVFNGTSAPANGTAPIMTPLYVAANAANVSLQIPGDLPIGPDGIVIVASSTAETLTADSSATLYISAFIEEFDHPLPSGHSTAGDLSTAVNSLQVWAESSGPKRLKRIRITNLTAAVRYACLYAEDSPDTNSRIVSWIKVPASESLEWSFGNNAGVTPEQIDGDGTRHVGCTVFCQETLTPGDEAAGNDFYIEATYI